MNAEQIAEIEARAAAATAGPWNTFDTDDSMCMTTVGVSTGGIEPWMELDEADNDHEHMIALTLLQAPRYVCHDSRLWHENANFIAHARTMMPLLIEALELAVENQGELIYEIARLVDPHASPKYQNQCAAEVEAVKLNAIADIIRKAGDR